MFHSGSSVEVPALYAYLGLTTTAEAYQSYNLNTGVRSRGGLFRLRLRLRATDRLRLRLRVRYEI